MTTHLRDRAVQAGAFLALVVGGIAVAPAMALADPPGVQITSLSPTEVGSGGQVTMRYTVVNNNKGEGGGGDPTNIVISGMSCSGDCSQFITLDKGDDKQFTANLTAPDVADGQSKQVQVQINVTVGGPQGGNASTSGAVNVKGDEKPQTVRQISGKVKDQDGKAISGAQVGMRDSANDAYKTVTNGSGSYVFTSSDTDPIAPGGIEVAAAKDGFQPKSVQIQGAAGRSVTASIVLKAIAASPSPSDSPSPSVSATTPADDATDSEADSDSGSENSVGITESESTGQHADGNGEAHRGDTDNGEAHGGDRGNDQPDPAEATDDDHAPGDNSGSDETVSFLYKPGTPMPNGAKPWEDFHVYGTRVDADHITWYIDGVQTNQITTPTKYMNGQFYMMLDYAIGGGWPLSGLVANSSFEVDWVRVYALPK